jgi:(1->4)-alpha-D-glucan 1-alpha-D-glucosylmutase
MPMPRTAKPARLPVSTYRNQLNQRFGFADLDKIVDYLHQIGITDCYLSPILMAKAGVFCSCRRSFQPCR